MIVAAENGEFIMGGIMNSLRLPQGMGCISDKPSLLLKDDIIMAQKRIVMTKNAARVESGSFFNPTSWTLWLLAVIAISLGGYNVGHAYGTNVVMNDGVQPVMATTTVEQADEPAMVVAAR